MGGVGGGGGGGDGEPHPPSQTQEDLQAGGFRLWAWLCDCPGPGFQDVRLWGAFRVQSSSRVEKSRKVGGF